MRAFLFLLVVTSRVLAQNAPVAVVQTEPDVQTVRAPSRSIIQAIATSPDGSFLAVARGPLQPGEFAKRDSSLEV